MEAKITLIYEDWKEAEAVSEAVSPDNIEAPEGLHVETVSKDNRVVTSVTYSGDSLMTFLSTIDDLLSCVSVAEKIFLAMKKSKRATA